MIDQYAGFSRELIYHAELLSLGWQAITTRAPKRLSDLLF